MNILGDVEAFEKAFEDMGYNRSNPLSFRINGSFKKIFIGGSDPVLKVIKAEEKLSPESLVWARVGIYQPHRFVASNFHEATLCSELHRKFSDLIKCLDDLGIKSFVAALKPIGKGKGKGRSSHTKSNTNTNGATRSFRESGKDKEKKEHRLITLSVAVNLPIPEH